MIRSIYPKFTALAFAITVSITLLYSISTQVEKTKLPPFVTYGDVIDKKQNFIGYFSDKIARTNRNILTKRQKLLSLLGKKASGAKFLTQDRQWIKKLATDYAIKDFDYNQRAHWIELSKRVDTIPPSMALAQGAVESAWGTSRFATQGNNFFGIWCYTKGCGMIPRQRKDGMTHEVRRYKTEEDAVKHFIHMLNTNKTYKLLRENRHAQRKNTGEISGYELAGSLKSYSGIGNQYIDIVRSVIKDNNLE